MGTVCQIKIPEKPVEKYHSGQEPREKNIHNDQRIQRKIYTVGRNPAKTYSQWAETQRKMFTVGRNPKKDIQFTQWTETQRQMFTVGRNPEKDIHSGQEPKENYSQWAETKERYSQWSGTQRKMFTVARNPVQSGTERNILTGIRTLENNMHSGQEHRKRYSHYTVVRNLENNIHGGQEHRKRYNICVHSSQEQRKIHIVV